MQAQTLQDEPYKYQPAIRHITDRNIHKFGPWAVIIHTMVMNARRTMQRWEQAAFDAAEAAGADRLDSSEDPEAKRTYRTLRRLRRDVDRLEMMLALEVAGRDMAHLNDEIVRCIDKADGNMKETIIRRLFKAGPCNIDYDWTQYVERRMDKMRKAGRLDFSYGFGRQQTKWFVVTEQLRQRAADKKAQEVKRAAEQKVLEARQQAVIDCLKAQGYDSARAKKYNAHEVVVSVTDLERLLGLGKNN